VSAPPDIAEQAALKHALRLAERGRYKVSPNPMVGAVLLRHGTTIAEGWHKEVGGPHAEAEALAATPDASGATLCVTLEPCDHQGRTPPCTEALIAAGVRRVVACHRDPDARVRGGGFERLRAAGIDVVSGFLVDEAVRLNWKYLVAKVKGRPAVTLKWAMSLDGHIATRSGDSRWITGSRSHRWSLTLREEHDAILVGSGTILADDPRLNRRIGLTARPNVRVVLDRRLRVAPTAALFGEEGKVLIYTAAATLAGAGERARALEERGAEVIGLADPTPQAALADLGERDVQSVLVEGGGEVLAAFVGAGLYDRVEVACAPLLLGGREAPTPLAGAGVEKLSEALRLDELETRRSAPDVLLGTFRQGCLPELSASVAG